MDFPVPGLPWIHKASVFWLSERVICLENIQAQNCSVATIHWQVPRTRSPILRFSACLSSNGSVRNRSRRQRSTSLLFIKTSCQSVSEGVRCKSREAELTCPTPLQKFLSICSCTGCGIFLPFLILMRIRIIADSSDYQAWEIVH